MDDLLMALALAAGFSLLIGFVELLYQSKAGFSSCWNGPALLYVVILLIGNTATTLVASATFRGLFAETQTQPVPFLWFWYAFLGVFGFEALLQNINVTFSGKGVLSINDWINKARDGAVAATVQRQTVSTFQLAHDLAQRLRTLPAADLNARVVNILGPARLTELINAAAAAGADEGLMKALALASEAPERASAIRV